jgi:Ni/Co efflux regulator RcnB
MRSLLFTTLAGLGLAAAGPALAQHAPRSPAGGHWHGGNGGDWHGGGRHDWGGSVGGRWIGGARAPGGWSAYRRPVRGWAMPAYWLAPSFTITDWAAYGLTAPPYGYHWSRYYDDAVLVDQYGRAMDCVNGLDWGGGYSDGYADRGDYDYDYSHDVGPGASYPPPPGARVERRVYRYEDGAPPPPVVVHAGPDCGCEGRVAGGWYYPPATTTTVTITSVPVTTTTTRTEYVEEARPVVHHVRRVYHPKRPTKLIRRYHTKLIKR